MPEVIYKFDNDISTDIIYPGRYMATVLPSETPMHAFADIQELNELLNSGVEKKSIIVAGNNFGCGSSREQAASALKGHELTIIAKSFARIFIQNAINLGLNVIISPEIEAEPGDEISIIDGTVNNLMKNLKFDISPLPKSRQAIIDAGGLIAYTRQRIIQER